MRPLRCLVALIPFASSTSASLPKFAKTGPIGQPKKDNNDAGSNIQQVETTKIITQLAPTSVALTSTATAFTTVEVVATEVVAVGAGPTASGEDPIIENPPTATQANGTSTVQVTGTSPDASAPGSDFPYVAILNSTNTAPFNANDEAGSGIVAIIDAEDPDSRIRDANKNVQKRQAVTQNFPDGDTITFQAHAPEGFLQPQIKPVFQQVVDTTTTSSSTTTTDISTTLTSGTTTTTTTTSEAVTATTTSTSTSWESPTTLGEACTGTDGTEYITGCSTTRTCSSSQTGLSTIIPNIPATCSDITTLCTVTVAYIISMDPSMTLYSTNPIDVQLTGTDISTTTQTIFSTDEITTAPTVTATVYSDDPNGFHVYITTLSDSNGLPTATYLFTDPVSTTYSSLSTSTTLVASIEQGYSQAATVRPYVALAYSFTILLWFIVVNSIV